jgi:SAM-dependent methyltransferase
LIPKDEFSRVQSLYFEAAEEEKFRHQTAHPYFSVTEKTLLESVRARAGERLLEVGCGEGGNLFFLVPTGAALFGVDLFPRKLEFARRQLPQCHFVCADVDQLPFSSELFDIVLCRDLLHHVHERSKALREIARVCRRGGRIVVIEPNGKNPIMRMQPMLVKAEGGIKRNSPRTLEELLVREIGVTATMTPHQPLPLFRVLLHYRFGWPRLGRWRWAQVFFDAFNRLAARLIPQSRWAYLVFEIPKK